MSTIKAKPVLLSDYTKPLFAIESIDLCFELDPRETVVRSRLQCRALADDVGPQALSLMGQDLVLLSIQLNNENLSESDYRLTDQGLTIHSVPHVFCLQIVTKISPQANTALSGLYVSGGNFCTQCEALGFRRITFYLDRPDVLSCFTTKVIADKKQYPVLLSNGHKVDHGDLADGKHFVTWHDPFKKPCYLFALVAGDLGVLEDHFKTCTGRMITLRIYSEHENIDRCGHAMSALKKAMRWDEVHYGREYDLDLFMIVAVNDFNFGAMENKGLNVFNAKYILANAACATDDDFAAIDTVVAHEYFHNWSGNRVTCRDWFQLSLKEGLTVFREQSFDESLVSKPVQRVKQVSLLRQRQFAEDSGPMAHPIQPKQYIQIDNFYTYTVYNKGAEVIRMLQTLLGEKAYRKACDLYFARFDGQAVTTNDFVDVMQESSGFDLSSFRRWYDQAGTPIVEVAFKQDDGCVELVIKQSIPTRPGQEKPLPMMMPLKLALLDEQGAAVKLHIKQGAQLLHGDTLVIDQVEQTVVFEAVSVPVHLSILRHFSAPVKLKTNLSNQALSFLFQHDNDPFNRWEAGQQWAEALMVQDIERYQNEQSLQMNDDYLSVFETLFALDLDDKIFQAQLFSLPAELYLAQMSQVVDVDAIHQVRAYWLRSLSKHFNAQWKTLYERCQHQGDYAYTASQVGLRKLKNQALYYWLQSGDADAIKAAKAQFDASLLLQLTDTMGALWALNSQDHPLRSACLDAFYQQWRHEPLMMNHWFSLQAQSCLPTTLEAVQALVNSADFKINNPNQVYALVGGFCSSNPVNFHRLDGQGYGFAEKMILTLDAMNPMVAARVAKSMLRWDMHLPKRQDLMCEALERMMAQSRLSPNVYELVSQSLKQRSKRSQYVSSEQ